MSCGPGVGGLREPTLCVTPLTAHCKEDESWGAQNAPASGCHGVAATQARTAWNIILFPSPHPWPPPSPPLTHFPFDDMTDITVALTARAGCSRTESKWRVERNIGEAKAGV